MTMNGTAWSSPCWGTKRASSVWTIPIVMPAAKAIGNDVKFATNAAAVAARTRFVIAPGCRVTIGAIRIAATPASAEPSAQFAVAMRSGDCPSDAAARSFSATAVVARPNRVDR